MSVTIEQQRQRVEQEMTKNVDDLDRSFLRKMQVNKKFIVKFIFEVMIVWIERYQKMTNNQGCSKQKIKSFLTEIFVQNNIWNLTKNY